VSNKIQLIVDILILIPKKVLTPEGWADNLLNGCSGDSLTGEPPPNQAQAVVMTMGAGQGKLHPAKGLQVRLKK
jgi:hypothetical protein